MGAVARLAANSKDTTIRHERRATDLYRSGSARLPPIPVARENRHRAHQADGDAARPVAGLFSWGRHPRARDRGRSVAGLRVHLKGQPRRRDHQRHRDPGARRSGRPGVQAGDGRQVGAVQALRRRRFGGRRDQLEGRRRDHHGDQEHRRDLRRHQFGGHQEPRVLPHRDRAAGAARHPGVPRRPARHRDHLLRRPDQRLRDHRPPVGGRQAGAMRRGSGGYRHAGTGQGDGRAAGKLHRGRQHRGDLSRARKGHEPVEERPRRRHRRADARRRHEGRRRLPRRLGQGRRDPGHGRLHGRPADHLRHGQSRSGDHPGGGLHHPGRRYRRHRAGRTIPTRSTTSWASPTSSAAPWTCARAG